MVHFDEYFPYQLMENTDPGGIWLYSSSKCASFHAWTQHIKRIVSSPLVLVVIRLDIIDLWSQNTNKIISNSGVLHCSYRKQCGAGDCFCRIYGYSWHLKNALFDWKQSGHRAASPIMDIAVTDLNLQFLILQICQF